MSGNSLPVEVRIQIAKWPDDAPRGAVAHFCRQVGISRSRFYEIRAASQRDGPLAAVLGETRRPKASPARTPAHVEDLVVWARDQLAAEGKDCGPISIRYFLEDRQFPSPSRATIARTLNRRGKVQAQPSKRPRSSNRFVYPHPNDMWQIDGFQWPLADSTIVVILQVLDDHSRRMLASRVAPSENTTDVWAVISDAIDAVGVPRRVLTDNGAAFNPERRGQIGEVTTRLRTLGVHPISTTPGHPQANGKNERVHQPLQNWLRARGAADTIEELQNLVDEFDDYYNNARRHQGLPDQATGRHLTPMQAWDLTDAAPAPAQPVELSAAPSPAKRPSPRRHKVANNGNISTSHAGKRITIQLGAIHARSTVITLMTETTVTVFDEEGTAIRDVTLDGRTYYGNGQRPGRPRTKVSGIS